MTDAVCIVTILKICHSFFGTQITNSKVTGLNLAHLDLGASKLHHSYIGTDHELFRPRPDFRQGQDIEPGSGANQPLIQKVPKS
jgi:hypothetical protein